MLHSDNDEIYLAKLMEDFPAGSELSVRDAIQLIQERYRWLWSWFPQHEIDPITIPMPIHVGVEQGVKEYLEEVEIQIRVVHRTLFKGIVSNAYLVNYVKKFTRNIVVQDEGQ